MEASYRRMDWIRDMRKIADPVLQALAQRKLKERMPLGTSVEDRVHYTHLEALGRLLAGLAPWLERPQDGEEEILRRQYASFAREAIEAGTDPASPDYMNFSEGHQPLVDAAFLAHAILRAPAELWEKQEERVRGQIVSALKATRRIKAFPSNWLLFSAMVEAGLSRMGEEWDVMRVDYAVKQHEQWYVGDGAYGDGKDYHWDYYNSFVIQPMLIDVLRTLGDKEPDWKAALPAVERRAARYAAVLERLISPDGTYPPIGRSIAYRFGAFQLLAQAALQHLLPEGVSPAQVRCALSAAIRRTLDMPRTFDEAGWLTVGLGGEQPEVGEGYISTGSLYLCTTVFLPLGLPAADPFWSGEDEEWTQRKAWSGKPFPIDKALGHS